MTISNVDQFLASLTQETKAKKEAQIPEVYCGYEGPRPAFLAKEFNGSGMILFLAAFVVTGASTAGTVLTATIIAFRYWAG